MTIFMKNHWLACSIAVIIGGIYASHHFFIPRFVDANTGAYYPITKADYFDEVLLYAPRAHASFLDMRPRGDFSLAEYPKSPSLLPMLNPFLLGGLGKIVGSMKAAFIASDFIFPAAIFLVVYALLCELIGAGYGAMLFASLFLFIPKLGISFPPVSMAHIKTLGQIVMPWLSGASPLYFSQFEEPKITFFFFALCVYFIIRAIKRRGKWDIAVAGISFGLLFYTYLYDWATILVAMGIMGVVFFIQKDYGRLKRIAWIVGIGFLVSSYFWFNFLQLRGMAQAADVIARLGGEFSHRIRFATVGKSYVRIAVFLSAFLLLKKKKLYPAMIAMSAMLVSYIVVVNEQVITGFNVQPDHWYRTQFLPIYAALCLIAMALYRRFFPRIISRFARPAIIIFLIYFFVASLAGQYVYAKSQASSFAIPRERMESFSWLEQHAKQGSVIGTLSFNDNLDLQLHTSHFIFLPFGLSTVAPHDEIWQRFFIMAKLWGMQPDKFAAFFKEVNGAYYLFGDQYGPHDFDGNFFPSGWRLTDAIMAEKQKAYEAFFAQKSPMIIPFQLDYLFVDAQEFPQWNPLTSLLPALMSTPVYENNRFRIYEMMQHR